MLGIGLNKSARQNYPVLQIAMRDYKSRGKKAQRDNQLANNDLVPTLTNCSRTQRIPQSLGSLSLPKVRAFKLLTQRLCRH